MKALTGFWPACPACGNRAKHDPRIRSEFARPGTGVPGQDPFEGVWCDVLSWLQEDPDAKAIALLNRLKSAHPDRFSDTHLRTLQRRVQQWRGIMAKKLVYAAVDEPVPELPAVPELALVGAGPQVLKFR